MLQQLEEEEIDTEMHVDEKRLQLVLKESLGYQGGPLLPQSLASAVSTASSATRFSLRTMNFLSRTMFGCMKMSTRLALDTTRAMMMNSIHATLFTLDRIGLRRTETDLLDISAALSKYFVEQGFSVAELLALSGLEMASSVTTGTIRTAEETVRLFDGVFGSTDTSFSLAAFVSLVRREYAYRDSESDFPSFSSLGITNIARALISYIMLVNKTRHRHLKTIRQTTLLSLVVAPDSGYVHKMDYPINVEEKLKILLEGYERSDSAVFEDEDEKRSVYYVAEEEPRIVWDAQSVCVTPNQASSLFTVPPFEREPTPVPAEPVELKSFHESFAHIMENLSHFVKYATGAYGRHFMQIFGIATYQTPPDTPLLDAKGRVHHPNHFIFTLHTQIPLEAIVSSSFQRKFESETHHSHHQHPLHIQTPTMHVPEFYVSLDHRRKLIVVTLRGTLGLSDVLTNLSCDYGEIAINAGKYSVHSGMLMQARCLAKEGSHLHDTVKKALDENETYGLVLNGHSLGGGVASLVGLLWSNLSQLHCASPEQRVAFWTSSQSGLPPFRPIHVYVFGPPAVMSLELSMAVRGLVTSVVHGSDFVSSLSLGLVRDMRKMAYSLTEEDSVGSGGRGKISDVIIRHAMYGDQYLYRRLHWEEDEAMTMVESPRSRSLESTISTNAIDEESREQEDWYWSIFSALKATGSNYEKLYAPGDIYWIHSEPVMLSVTNQSTLNASFYSKSESFTHPTGFDASSTESIDDHASSHVRTRRVNLTYIDDVAGMFSTARFAPSMFLDHSPGRYEWCLKAMSNAIPK